MGVNFDDDDDEFFDASDKMRANVSLEELNAYADARKRGESEAKGSFNDYLSAGKEHAVQADLSGVTVQPIASYGGSLLRFTGLSNTADWYEGKALDLSGTDLSGSILGNMRNVSLKNATLDNCVVNKAQIASCDFTGASMNAVIFNDTSLVQSNLTRVTGVECQFNGGAITDCIAKDSPLFSAEGFNMIREVNAENKKPITIRDIKGLDDVQNNTSLEQGKSKNLTQEKSTEKSSETASKADEKGAGKERMSTKVKESLKNLVKREVGNQKTAIGVLAKKWLITGLTVGAAAAVSTLTLGGAIAVGVAALAVTGLVYANLEKIEDGIKSAWSSMKQFGGRIKQAFTKEKGKEVEIEEAVVKKPSLWISPSEGKTTLHAHTKDEPIKQADNKKGRYSGQATSTSDHKVGDIVSEKVHKVEEKKTKASNDPSAKGATSQSLPGKEVGPNEVVK